MKSSVAQWIIILYLKNIFHSFWFCWNILLKMSTVRSELKYSIKIKNRSLWHLKRWNGNNKMYFIASITHLVIWGTGSTCSVPRSFPRCHSNPPDWSGREAACCCTETIKKPHQRVWSVIFYGGDQSMSFYTHGLFGCCLLKAAALRFVSRWEGPHCYFVRRFGVWLVVRLNDDRGVWCVVNTNVNLHWKQRKGTDRVKMRQTAKAFLTILHLLLSRNHKCISYTAL